MPNRNNYSATLSLVICATLFLGAGYLCAQEPIAGKKRAQQIFFRSDRGGVEFVSGLYCISFGSDDCRQIIANKRSVVSFALNPNGKSVALVCDPKDTEMFELSVLSLASRKEKSIHKGIRFAPVWSQSGKRLAYMHYSQKWRIRLTNPDLVIERPKQEHIGGDGAVSWFPDDKRILFQSNRTKELEIFVGDAKTGKATQITNTKKAQHGPSLSPDGNWIAYRDGSDIFVVQANGKKPRNLTGGLGKNFSYQWAKDSKRIVFVSDRGGNQDLYLQELKVSSKPTRLTRHAKDDFSPAWSPDDKHLAFVSTRDGNEEIYTINIRTKKLRRVTKNKARDRSPQWLRIDR